jgi:hypothetical protein
MANRFITARSGTAIGTGPGMLLFASGIPVGQGLWVPISDAMKLRQIWGTSSVYEIGL